jgi:hypothetical protein
MQNMGRWLLVEQLAVDADDTDAVVRLDLGPVVTSTPAHKTGPTTCTGDEVGEGASRPDYRRRR